MGTKFIRSLELCGERHTFALILNHCLVVLDLRRYNARHDGDKPICEGNCLPDVEAVTDLPGSVYTFLAFITPTDLHSDITQKSVVLVELKTKFVGACRQNANKYDDLVETGGKNGFDISTIIIPLKLATNVF